MSRILSPRRPHRPPSTLMVLVALLLAACGPAPIQNVDVTVTVNADGNSQQVALPTGSTVEEALHAAAVSLSQIDRVDPPAYTTLANGMTIVVMRVREEFDTRQEIVPFERQQLRNESLPSGETRLIQAGANGLREITTRHVFENGVEGFSSIVSETILQDAVPEIVMVGVQSPFTPLTIPGKLAFLTGGNAWLMDGSTANRRPLVTTGDLDGHVFDLSSDGQWLLFTRKSTQPPDQQINTLWAVSTSAQAPAPVDLGVANVVHFAAWQPGTKYLVAYSTVEPRSTAPGWQANNDLHFLEFNDKKPGRIFDILGDDTGGLYGWWGVFFAWSPDGSKLAYARPDGVGLVNIEAAGLMPLTNITPFNTRGDWAWVPGLAWGSDSRTLYLVTHAAPTGLVTAEDSPNFDLAVINLTDNVGATLVEKTGMFAYPAVSSPRAGGTGLTNRVAYLQALFTTQSATSRYRLMVMTSDGKDARLLFPAEGQTGLQPQTPVWAPRLLDNGGDLLGILYEGNLWIVDAASGQSQQVTGDGLTSRIDWK